MNNRERIGVLRRTAKETRRYRVTMKILGTMVIMLSLLVGCLYATSALYKNTGSFTISLDKFEMTKYGLTLSESRNMTYQTSHLNAKSIKNITNIAEEQIPDNVDMIDGAHNGDDYIAYTFYLQNAGEVEVAYEYSVTMSNITNGLDEAIRVKLYVDGQPTVYAKTASDGDGAEPGTVEFSSVDCVTQGRREGFKPLDITKFTIVVWIEGNDPDCVDWLIGGELKLDMNIGIIH